MPCQSEKLKRLIKELSAGTFVIKKVGKKYRVKDVVEFDGDYGLMTEKEILKNFG